MKEWPLGVKIKKPKELYIAGINCGGHFHSLVSLWSFPPTHANMHVMADIYFGLACTFIVSALLL
ncbi:MAG TPA: hypothetical protein VFC46_09935, partial [Humisphaera sp.]|nr:hypothetical protein [Humisphaera sp.]